MSLRFNKGCKYIYYINIERKNKNKRFLHDIELIPKLQREPSRERLAISSKTLDKRLRLFRILAN